MNAELGRITVLENTYALNTTSYRVNLEIFKEKVEKHIQKIKRVLDIDDIDKLSDDDFYKLLVDTYYITLDVEDLLKLLSIKYHKKYIANLKIPTNMTFTNTATEGRGRSFDYWEQLYQVVYDAFISSDMDYDFNKVYTREEVEKLVTDKTIILSGESHRPINENDISFTNEEFKPLSIGCNFDTDGNALSDFTKDNYSLYVKYLRKKFSKQKILSDIEGYIVDLKKDIEAITNLSNKGDDPYSEISRLCNKWYESSNTKKDFMLLQRKLN